MTCLARGFVAVVPPDALLDALDARLRALHDERPPLRWLPRQQWHLTLKFLGRVDDADALTGAVHAATRGRSPFTLQLGGAGAFPTSRRASVLWIGVAAGAAELAALAAAVDDASAGLVANTEHRPYHPHLTVARAAAARPVHGPVDALGATPIGPAWTVTELALVESDTRRDGAVHTVRARLPLEGA